MAIRKNRAIEEKQAYKPKYDSSSKMRNYDIIFDEENKHMRLGFYNNKIKDKRIPPSAQFYTVDLSTQYRIDLISLLFYDTPIYDWVIKDANNISDPIRDLYVGRRLIIPSLNSIGV